jgi:hypothetical protein
MSTDKGNKVLGEKLHQCHFVHHKSHMTDDEYGAVGAMRIGRGNVCTGRKLVPVPLCPPQIPHDG